MQGLYCFYCFTVFTDFAAFTYFPTGKRKRRFFMPYAMGRGLFLLPIQLWKQENFFLLPRQENVRKIFIIDISGPICNNCYATYVIHQFFERRIPYAACSQDNEGNDIEYCFGYYKRSGIWSGKRKKHRRKTAVLHKTDFYLLQQHGRTESRISGLRLWFL